MNSILLFAFVLAVAGGAIAYIGDRLGTYVGKRRMSVIGLRPRHTAMLYTICSGGAIALVTLGFLVLIDHAFQRALLEGPQLIYQNTEYQRQISRETLSAAAAQRRAQAATDQLQLSRSALQPIQRKLALAQNDLGRSRQTLQTRQQQLALAQHQLLGARTSLAGTNRKLAVASQSVGAANAALSGARVSLLSARTEVRQQQARVQTLLQQSHQLVAYNLKLQSDTQVLLPRIETSMRHALIYRPGQEVGRTVIVTTQPTRVIEDQLTAFLNRLSETAERSGARPGLDNQRAVVIALPRSVSGGDPSRIAPQEHAAISALAQNIAAKSDSIASVVVIAEAQYNTFRGEQAGIELYPYDNVLIYSKGAVVASLLIDGTQSELQILNALQQFLTDQVRPAVRRQGLIPQADPATGQPIMGAVDETTSLNVVKQIQLAGPAARVTASVDSDTYSSGPLRLRLNVASTAAPSQAVPTPLNPGRRS